MSIEDQILRNEIALRAIKARIAGEWDNTALSVVLKAISGSVQDDLMAIAAWANRATPPIRTPLEVMRALVISTGHLTEQTRRMLDADETFARFKWPYGWIVSTDDAVTDHKDYPDLVAVLVWAELLGFDWVRFDADGNRIPDLAWHEEDA